MKFRSLHEIRQLIRNKRRHQDHIRTEISNQYYRPSDRPLDPHRRMVILMIDGHTLHGGMADRIKGCLGIYALCKKRDIPFRINWCYPFDLQLFLEPGSYDWRIDPRQIVYETPYSQPVARYTFDLPGEEFWDKRAVARQLRFDSHTQYHLYTNTMLCRKAWSRSFGELFKPTPLLQQAIDKNRSELNGPYVSFTLRFQQLLGDFREGPFPVLEESERERLIERCLDKLAELIDRVPESHRILVTSDSITFLNRVRQLPRTYVIPGEVAHMNYPGESLVFLKSFLDFYLIMGADEVHLLQTGQMYRSGFPQFAAEIGRKPFIVHTF